MGSGLIEIHDICFEKPREVLLMQDEEVIQTFSPVLATWHIRSEMKRKSLDSDGSFRLNHISWQEM